MLDEQNLDLIIEKLLELVERKRLEHIQECLHIQNQILG